MTQTATIVHQQNAPEASVIDKQTFDIIINKLTDRGESIKPDWQPAMHQLLFTSVSLAISVYFLSSNSYVIYPFALLFTCFSLCLLHLIAMDCVHQLFTPSQLFNRLLGELTLFPFVQPFESFSVEEEVSVESSTGPVSAQDKLKTIVDHNVYDDSQPIHKTLLKKLNTGNLSAISMGIYGLQATIISLAFYNSPLSVVRYWLLPVLLYPFLYPSVMLVFSNDIDSLLLPSMSSGIPSYHLAQVSSLITEYVSGKLNAKARMENTPQKKNESRNFVRLARYSCGSLAAIALG